MLALPEPPGAASSPVMSAAHISAVTNLMAMGKRHAYVHFGSDSGLGKVLPIDLFIPGHPPHPLTLLDGLLRLLGRLRGT